MNTYIIYILEHREKKYIHIYLIKRSTLHDFMLFQVTCLHWEYLQVDTPAFVCILHG